MGGRERCSFCLYGYALETGYRCDGCDHPVCAMCIVLRRRSILCPGCPEDSVRETPSPAREGAGEA